MNLLAILAALALEQWRAPRWRLALDRAYTRHALRLERAFNGGTSRHGVAAVVVAVVPPVAIVALLWWALSALHPAAGWLFNVLVLYALMGFRRFSHAVSELMAAFKAGDLDAARRALTNWRGESAALLSSTEVTKLAIERGLVDSYRQVFAVLFWFVVLPGPAGAVLYRAVDRLADAWRGPRAGEDSTPIARERVAFAAPARGLLALLDWIPSRLTAIAFAVVGDFEDAVACWRTQALSWPRDEGGQAIGVVLASGAGALGVTLGGAVAAPGGEPAWRPDLGLDEPPLPEVLPSAVALVWRSVVLTLAIILLVTIANLLP